MKRTVIAIASAIMTFAMSVSNARADWTLSGTVLTDEDTNWKFNVKTDFSYDDGVETFTGLQITSINKAGTGTVVDLRNKALPDGVTLIAFGGGNAFATITELYLPDTVVYIGDCAFQSKTIQKIYPGLPDSVRYVGKYAFYRVGSFAGDGTGKLTVGGGGHPFSWSDASLTDFNNDTSLKQLVFGAGVTNIGIGMFNGCTGLTNVTFLAGSLKSIGKQAFYGCSGLTGFTPELPSTLAYLGEQAFYGCSKLTSMRLGGSAPLTFEKSEGDGRWLFRVNALTNVTIGAGVSLPLGTLFEYDGGEGVLKDIVCEGFPANLHKAFCRHRYNYQHRYTVPEENAEWKTYLVNNSYTPWEDADATAKSKYAEVFGANAPAPSGTAKFVSNGASAGTTQFVVLKSGQVTGVKRLLIATDPEGIGADGLTPAYGDHKDVSSELPLTCSAGTEPAVNAEGTIVYDCTGYTTYSWTGEDWKQESEGKGRTVVYNPVDDGYGKIVWKWQPSGYRVSVSCPQAYGTVSIDGTQTVPGYFDAGTTVTLTATATGAAPFVRWFGDVPAQQVSNVTITVTADAVKRLVPYFKDNWTWNGSNRITDGYWTLVTAGPKEALVLRNGDVHVVASTEGAEELDLDKPVNDGGRIVALGNKAFRSCPHVKTLFLPDDLESIGNQAFEYGAVEQIVPFVPQAVTNIGGAAFSGAGVLRSAFRVGGRPDELGPVTLVSFSANEAGMFENAKNLESVTFGARVTSAVPVRAFRACGGLRELYFEGYMGIGTQAFDLIPALSVRCHIPKGNVQWDEFLSDKLTAWADCEADHDKYWTAFDPTKTTRPPRGKATFGGTTFWIVTWNPYGSGLMILVK